MVGLEFHQNENTNLTTGFIKSLLEFNKKCQRSRARIMTIIVIIMQARILPGGRTSPGIVMTEHEQTGLAVGGASRVAIAGSAVA